MGREYVYCRRTLKCLNSVIKQSKVHYVANESIFSFTKEGKAAIDIIFRISNNNVAFKYKVHPQKEARSCVVQQEASGFLLPEGTTTFLCPQSKPMGGNQTDELLHSKETIKKKKRQTEGWEKIASNDTTDKGLVYKIYKQQQKNQQPN